MAKIRWLSEPQPHDYPAAASYLSLIADNATITAILAALQAAPPYFHQTTEFTCGPACIMMALAWADWRRLGRRPALLTVLAAAGSYTRMLLKTERFNQVRQDNQQLRKDYSQLAQVAHDRDVQPFDARVARLPFRHRLTDEALDAGGKFLERR